MYSIHPVIAAIEVKLIFWIIIGIVSFVSWISKKLKENQEKAGMARPQKDDAIRNEIDSFLQDVLGTKPNKKTRKDEGDFLEVVEEQPRRKQQRKRKPRQQQNTEDRTVRQSASVFGSDLKQHVSKHFERENFEEEIGHDVDQSVSSHLGAFSSGGDDIELISSSDQLRADIIKIFQNPTDVRKAIVLNLILTPPASLKKK